MPDRRITATIVRWTPTEIATVRARAAECGRTVARFVRESALGAIPKARRNADLQAVLRELARSGNNLNQLAREANTRELFPDEAKIAAVLAQHVAAIERLVDPAGG
jgi:hypothetical protein